MPWEESTGGDHTPPSGTPLPKPKVDEGAVSLSLGPNGEVERVGPYRVLGVLGRGGMGVVYEVEPAGGGARYALKVVETRFLEGADASAAHRFRHEIRILERLSHPGVVRLFDAGIARHPMGYDLAYYVMEKLEGETLLPRVKGQAPSPPEEALLVVEKLADALAYLEDKKVLHRDVKPGNVFLESSGRVILLDFGLARSQEFTRLTLAGQIVGTFLYMSPERLAGQPVGVAGDIFALGVVFFQLLTGQHPFGAGTPPELMAAIHRGIVWPPEVDELPRAGELREMLRAMLSVDPAMRPAPSTLASWAHTLRGTLVTQSAPVSALAQTTVKLVERDGPPADPFLELAREPGPSWLVFALLSATVACLAFAAGLLIGSKAPSARAAPPEHAAEP